MTLKAKSIIISLLVLVMVIFSFKLFTDYNELNNSIITSLLVAENILGAEEHIYKSLTGAKPDMEAAKKIAGNIPEAMKPLESKKLPKNELRNLITTKLAFIRIGSLLKALSSDRTIEEPELKQIHNELKKIELSINEFRESFSQRIERERTFKKNIVAIIYVLSGLSIIFLFIGFYRYFIGPILNMSSQIKAVGDGKIGNISIYQSRDEIGRLSAFTYKTLNDLYESNEAISQRYEMQYAVSEILKASQKAGDISLFLKKVLETILSIKWLSIQGKGGIFLLDEVNPEMLILKADKDMAESLKKMCAEVPFGKCLCGKGAKNGKSIHKSSLDEEHEIVYEGIFPHGHYCVPIKHEDKVMGIIVLYLENGHILSSTEIEFIEAISLIIAETLIIKRLIEREHLITQALEESGEGVMIANRDMVIEYVNPALENMTGYSRDELIGRKLYSQIQSKELTDNFLNGIAGQNIWSGTLKNKRKDGTEYEERISVIPVKDEKGETIRFVSIRDDITTERRLEEQLRQAQKMEIIGKLAGGVAHDFNNYMTAILGHGELALDSLKDEEPSRKNIQIMIEAANMASALTKQLLAFSRKQIISPKVINLDIIIKEMGKMLKQIIGEDIEFKVITEPELWNVRVDSGQIGQAIMNLVVNAKDAMPEGGKLTIETANVLIDEEYTKGYLYIRPGGYVMISVSDTGAGMTEDIRSHIFEPFFTTKEIGKGIGLGLATVYGIIKQNNGYINVYSEPGRGTTFRIYLPCVREEAETGRKEIEATDKPRGSETVLVVEDKDEVRQIAATVLAGLGYTVIEAKDGFDALELCKRYHGKIHILLTDVVMPKIGGHELAEKIKEQHTETKIIYMSGYTENAIAHHGVLDKGINFIQKPFTASELAKEIRRILDTR